MSSKLNRALQIFQLLLLLQWTFKAFKHLRHTLAFYGLVGSLDYYFKQLLKFCLSSARKLPILPVNQIVQHQIKETLGSLSKQFITTDKTYLELPQMGLNFDQLNAELTAYSKISPGYTSGQVSGTVYHGGIELNKCINLACSEFIHTNPLHPDVFPSIRKMEAEIIHMVLQLYYGTEEGCGNVTSGGTESILLACKAYRDKARSEHGITRPQMIVPVTAHAAFDKAGHYFNIELIKIPLDANYKVDLALVKASINANTIMLVGSSPNFPHGIIDDISGLSNIALQANLPLHVDCCLGSFLMAFMQDAGYSVPMFDFRLPGVTSMSVDTHKYGYAPKGSSVIMYKNTEFRKYQYFVATDWPGGVYASPSLAGSRPGSLIAGCWAAMLHMGKEGYIASTKAIIETAREIVYRVQTQVSEDLEIIGDPLVSVVAIRAKNGLSIYGINDEMSKSGWNLNALQFPECIHLACTFLTVGKSDLFIRDLIRAVQQVKAHPELCKSGSSAIYGMAASIPDRSIVGDISYGYLDMMTKIQH